MKITATIITCDEEENVARAIRSVGFCDEVLVVDSGSEDQTVAIAKSMGATVIRKDWPGYAAQKNFAAEHAQHNWILSLDADEAVTPELAASIEDLQSAHRQCAGLRLPTLGPLLRKLGPTLRLVSRPQGPPLRQDEGTLGGQVRA